MVPRERDKNALRSDVCPKIILTVQWGVTWAGNGTEPICITFQRETILKVAYWAPQQKIPFGQIVHMGKVSPIGPYSASSDYSLSTVLHSKRYYSTRYYSTRFIHYKKWPLDCLAALDHDLILNSALRWGRGARQPLED